MTTKVERGGVGFEASYFTWGVIPIMVITLVERNS